MNGRWDLDVVGVFGLAGTGWIGIRLH